MRWLTTLLILIALSYGAHALTVDEEDALAAFLLNFMELANFSPPWSASMNSACGTPTKPPFYGITCSEEAEPHVTRLELNIGNLIGSVPSEIRGLQWLQVFSITNGCVSQALPDEIGELSNLLNITLSDAPGDACERFDRTSTNITDGFVRLSSLQFFYISMQSLAGSLPDDIGNLTSLEHLRIYIPTVASYKTGVEGHIPTSLYELSLLKTLYLVNTSYVAFLGATTSSVLPSLEEFSLSGSLLYGGAHVILKSSKKLRMIDFSNVNFRDDFSLLDDLPHLTYINIDNSNDLAWKLTPSFWSTHPELVHLSAKNGLAVMGSISDTIGQMRKLTYLNLESTQVKGTLPSSIGQCPLEYLNVAKSSILPLIPEFSGPITSTLVEFYMSDLIGPSGTIPESIGLLEKLEYLDLSSNALNGTIPLSFSNLRNLKDLRLFTNAFNGSLPDLNTIHPLYADLASNHFNGTIPQSLATCVSLLYASNNELGPTIPQNLFVANKNLRLIEIPRNQFSGPLPLFNIENPPEWIDVRYNQFSGEIPTSYALSKALQLGHNLLNGSLDALIAARPNNMIVLYLERNKFQGTVPNLDKLDELRVLALSNNDFSGHLPLPSPNMQALALSNNRFGGSSIIPWTASVRNSSLRYLDISSNEIVSYLYSFTDFIGPKLTYLSLANNQFVSVAGSAPTPIQTALTGLDVSNCELSGSFPAHLFPEIVVLKLSQNAFSGDINLQMMQSLTQLDISDNNFKFDVSKFSGLPLLTNIQARGNQLFGSLLLYNLPSLQSADFSANLLDYTPDLNAIGTLFNKSRLLRLNISDNPRIPRVDGLQTSTTGLGRSSLSSPSNISSKSVTCFELIFYNKTSVSFVFDENLFDYAQCDCSIEYFGSPPFNCLKCPSSGIESCKGPNLEVSKNFFIESMHNASVSPTRTAMEETSFSFSFYSTLLDGIASLFNVGSLFVSKSPKSTDLDDIDLETESCLVKTVQVLSRHSNCRGLNLTAEDLANHNVPIAKLLEPQCEKGSEGRLCSKCACDPSGVGPCWFEKGATCTQCRSVFRLSTSLPLAFALLALLIVTLSIVMTIILRRKRAQNLASLSELSLLKRSFYRLQYLTTLGNLSIMITFLQILIAFTQWDAYARVEFFGVINGASASLGIQCLLPFLSDPMWALVGQLSLPFFAVGILALSIVIGSVISRFIDRRVRASKQTDSDGEEVSLVVNEPNSVAVHFPATALLTSWSITVVKFLYFGTALAAHEYLFSNVQPSTGVHYVQSKPWMRYSDAWSLILASIPAILIFDLAIPLTFIIICWKVRNSFKLHKVQIYFGSLLEVYHPSCFWWEIVNTLKKLSIALVLKAIPASNPVQSALVVSILSGVLLIQVTLSPWRRKMENFADTFSSLLLILALIYTRPLSSPHLSGVLWYIFVLSIVFVFGSLGAIAWQTWNGVTEYEKQQRRVLSNFELDTQQEHNHGLNSEDWALSSENEQLVRSASQDFTE